MGLGPRRRPCRALTTPSRLHHTLLAHPSKLLHPAFPRSSAVANNTLAKSGLLAGSGTSRVIAVRSATGTVVQPDGETYIQAGDVIIVQGEREG